MLKTEFVPTVASEAMDADQSLALKLVNVVEQASIASARLMGQGDRNGSDRAAVEAMRSAFDEVSIDGTIVIGEGERDEAPMLYIGERVGAGGIPVDIAVDPLEGTNLCALGTPGAITTLAAAERDGLMHAPDCYMEKIIAGPACRGALDIDAPVKDNLRTIARCLDRNLEDLVVIVLDRPRHEKLIADIRDAGARIKLIGDGDLSAGISVAVRGAGVHAVMGIGGAPEGVLTAAALRCLHGEMVARFVVDSPELKARFERMGVSDPHRIYTAKDLAPGKNIIFAACGVTEGTLLNGVRFFGGGCRTHSLVMSVPANKVRFVDTVHLDGHPGPRGIRLH